MSQPRTCAHSPTCTRTVESGWRCEVHKTAQREHQARCSQDRKDRGLCSKCGKEPALWRGGRQLSTGARCHEAQQRRNRARSKAA